MSPRDLLRFDAPCATVLLLGLTLGLGACRQSGTLVTPVRFDRPRAVAFACFDSSTQLFVEHTRCEGLDEADTESVGMTALVAQTARGEVAAVDLRTGQVLDSDGRVPGFTFRRVGVDPVAIVVPPNAPATTYVASRGSRSVEWMPTADFRPDAIGPASSSGEVVLERGAPADLALSADGTMLFAPLPDVSALAQIPILEDGSLGSPTIVDLDGSLPAAVQAPATAEPFERVCPVSAGLRAVVSVDPRPTDAFDVLPPAPTRILVDGTNGDLWIADANLPLIHHLVVDTLGATPTTPLNVGTPVGDLALTPVVPASLGTTAESAPARYLYAVDVEHGDVMAVDLLDGSPSYGAVLPVNSGLETPDRIHLPSRVRALTVLEPDVGASVCTEGSDMARAAGPDMLRGVFLAVGLADGSVRIVDVYDLDASCRGGDMDCASPTDPFDVNIYIRRHEPRIGALLSRPVRLAASPTFSFESSPGLLDETGAEQTHTGPGLSPQDACPAHMAPVWPAAAQEGASAPVVCAATDPWELPAERWIATWEGALPGTQGPGRLLAELDGSEGPWLSALAGRMCERGVLGAEDSASLGADDPQASYGGDEMIITSELPSASESLTECEAFLTPTDGSERALVGFAIVAASDDRLRLGDALGSYTFADILTCFPGLLTYEVRTRGAYAVLGSTSGFSHRVAADGGGRCAADASLVVDASEPRSYRQGRAFAGALFDNGLVSFTIQHDDLPVVGVAPNARAQLAFSLAGIPPGLGVSLRSAEGVGAPAAIVDELIWNPTDQSLFGVDGQGNRLVQLRMDPFQMVRSLR